MKSINQILKMLPTPNLISGPGSCGEFVLSLQKEKVKRILVVSTAGPESVLFEDKLQPSLDAAEEIEWCLFDKVEPDPPIRIVEEGIELARQKKVDAIVAFGGGSSIDTAKVIAAVATNGLNVDNVIGEDKISGPVLPLFAIPTTAGTGSEVTHIAILSDERDQFKKGITSPKIIPKYAILDPLLTLRKPPSLTANTGLDALSHALEAYNSVNATILTDMYAKEAMTLILENIHQVYTQGNDVEARYKMLLGSHLAGIAFSNAGVTAAHALAYPLGAKYHIPHGASVMLLLPAVIEYNSVGNEQRYRELSALFTGKSVDACQPDEVIGVLNVLCDALNMPANLQEVGVEESLLDEFAEAALKVVRVLRNNPRPITTVEHSGEIYRNAYRYDRTAKQKQQKN